MAYDKNFVEHHMMVAELMKNHDYEEGRIILYNDPFTNVSKRHFSVSCRVIEKDVPEDDEMATGMTCLVGTDVWSAVRCWSRDEALGVTFVNDPDCPIIARMFGNLHFILDRGVEGFMVGYVDRHADQEFWKTEFING